MKHNVYSIILLIFAFLNIVYTCFLVYASRNVRELYTETMEQRNSFEQWMEELGIDDISELSLIIENGDRMKVWQSIILQRNTTMDEIKQLFTFKGESLFDMKMSQDSLKSIMQLYDDYDSTITFDCILPLTYSPYKYKFMEMFLFNERKLVDIVDGCNSRNDSIVVNKYLYGMIGKQAPLYYYDSYNRSDSLDSTSNISTEYK